jgi:asparagine synthase (glutamine-hydrolysing)
MCGITGIYNLDHSRIDKKRLNEMNNRIRHRGPDDEGYFLINPGEKPIAAAGRDTMLYWKERLPDLHDPKVAGVLGIGFRRLSILDTSVAGHQPMSDESGDYWIIFNGEVYNYIELRKELKALGYNFRSGTDTEVVLKAYIEWGTECFDKFNGMWAIVIWDNTLKELLCCRDRYAIKPFNYIYLPGRLFAFSSEIKAIYDFIPCRANNSLLREFLLKGISSDREGTFFENIKQLAGGHYIRINDNSLSIKKWYKLDIRRNSAGFDTKKEEFKDIFEDAVRIRQRSDVTLGYSLSGGLDSSSIVTTARAISKDDNNSTFSLVFPGYKYDESKYIEAVLEKTGFPHYQTTVDYDTLLEDIDKFVYSQEEPVSGLSFYGQYKLRELYKQNRVTVSLEGQGADEIISGYKSDMLAYLSGVLQRGNLTKLLKTVHQLPKANRISYQAILKNLIKEKVKHSQFSQGYSYYSDSFFEENTDRKYTSILACELHQQLFSTSLPYLLRQADKSSMAFSQEARFPFLDYRLVEFCFGLQDDDRISGIKQKRILRESMQDILPDMVYNRTDKIGFSVPMESWMKKGLKGELGEYIYTDEFMRMPFIDESGFKKKLKNYLKNDESDIRFDFQLWKILSVYLWRKRFKVEF